MDYLKNSQKILMKFISIVQFIAYIIAFLLISVGIINSFIHFIMYNLNSNMSYTSIFKKTRLDLVEMLALSLSFILGAEILRLFYINSYKQLFILTWLVVIKLLLNYFLVREITQINKK